MSNRDTRIQRLREAIAAQTVAYPTISQTEAIYSALFDESDWEYGVTWLEGDDRVHMPTENDWRARTELTRMNQSYPYPEENYVVRRPMAGDWERVDD